MCFWKSAWSFLLRWDLCDSPNWFLFLILIGLHVQCMSIHGNLRYRYGQLFNYWIKWPERDIALKLARVLDVTIRCPLVENFDIFCFRFHANYLLLPWKIPGEISRRSMPFHNEKHHLPYQTLCTNNVLPWKWIDYKCDVEWKYLQCYIICKYCVFIKYDRGTLEKLWLEIKHLFDTTFGTLALLSNLKYSPQKWPYRITQGAKFNVVKNHIMSNYLP